MTRRGSRPDSIPSNGFENPSTKTCSRCDAVLEKHHWHGIWFAHGSPMTKNESFSLCDDCEYEFQEFLAGEPVELGP